MDKIKFSGVRGEEGLKEVEFDYNGRTIHAAVVSGLGNADALMKKIQKGEVHYDFVEVMACRRGCIMGGGQPVPAGPRSRIARSKGLYDTDINTQIKKSNENPLILSLYDELLKGKTHELLHRNFEAAKKIKLYEKEYKTMQSSIWRLHCLISEYFPYIHWHFFLISIPFAFYI